MTERGIGPRAVDRFRLGFDGERLTIPYLTPAGPWHVKRRCIQHGPGSENPDQKCDTHPKYKNDDGASQHLFNAQTLLRADRVVVVEGELDAISVEMAGAPCVAFPGADTWRKNRHWLWVFDSVEEVIVVADGDEPREGKTVGVGEEAAKTVADSLRSALPDLDVRMVVMPVGHDSNSFINEHGPVDYLDQIGWL